MLIAESGTNTIVRKGVLAGHAIALAAKSPLTLRGETGATLLIQAQGSEEAGGSPICYTGAPNASTVVSFESGNHTLVAAGTVTGPSIPKLVANASSVVIAGGTLTPQFRVTTAAFSANAVAGAASGLFSGTLTVTGGVVNDGGSAKNIPVATSKLSSNTNYKFPAGVFDAVAAVATGGCVLGKAYLHCPSLSEDAPVDYARCFASADTAQTDAPQHPAAVEVDYERQVVIVDTAACADPVPYYPVANEAAAVEVFGLTPALTDTGFRAPYAFGVTRLSFSEGDDELPHLFLDVAVELPESAPAEKTFLLSVILHNPATDVRQTLFCDDVLFTRPEAGTRHAATVDVAPWSALEGHTSLFTVTAAPPSE